MQRLVNDESGQNKRLLSLFLRLKTALRIDQNSDGTVVDEFYCHVRAELAVGDSNAERRRCSADVLEKGTGGRFFRGSYERRTASFTHVTVQRELRDEQQRS